jgi:hypothetical protein
MTLHLQNATVRLSREMDASETTLSEALVSATALMHSAAVALRDVPDSPKVKVQATLLHLNKLVAGLVEANGEAARVHGHLLDIAREMGATELWYCPPKSEAVGPVEQAA